MSAWDKAIEIAEKKIFFLKNGYKYFVKHTSLDVPKAKLTSIVDKDSGIPKDVELYPIDLDVKDIEITDLSADKNLSKQDNNAWKGIVKMKNGGIYTLDMSGRLFNSMLRFMQNNEVDLDTLITIERKGIDFDTEYVISVAENKKTPAKKK